MKKQNCLITTLALALMVTTVPVNATNTTTVAPLVTTTTTTTEATVKETVVKEETATLDLSGYTNDKLNVYENSRATKIYYDSNKNTLTIEGYAFVNGKNFDKANGLWREVILVNADNTSTDYAYREQVTSVAKGQFLTSNKNINPNGNLNYTYAMYTVTLDLNKMKKYDNKTYESLKGGNYLIYIRCSDGKDGKLMPLQNITLSDGSRMDLPEQFKSIDYTNSLGVSIGGERAVPELEKPIVTFVDNKLAGQKPEPTPTPETEKQEEKPKKPSGGGSGGSGGGGGGGGSSSRPDTQKPTVSIVSLGTNETNGSIYINVKATDNKGVTGYAISTRNSATYDDLTWQSSSQFVVDEYGTYYVYATDAKKNMSYVKAVVSIPTYTITYVTDGGSVAETAKTSYERGTSAEVTNVVATRNGYTFDRWYSDAALTVPATDITTSDYGNKTYYAKFNPNTYNIQYVDSMNGTLDGTNPTTFTAGEDVVTLILPTKDGYNFNGWMVNGNKYTTITVDMFAGLEDGETITLTSEWSIISYDITYVMDGGINSNTNPTTYTIESEEFTLVNPTKAGFTFDNWYSDAEFNTVADTTVEHGSTGNKTYYAKFNPNTYNIQYVDSMNGTLDGTNPTTFTTGGDDVTLVSPTKDGYNFDGWMVNGNKYTTITADMFEGLENGETITLTSEWSIISYDITYVMDGGINSNTNPTTYTIESEEFTLVNPTKAGFTFDNWYSDAEFNTVADTTVEHGSTGNKTYYAKFNPNTYNIQYVDSVNGTLDGTNPTTFTTGGDDATLVSPTKEGYNFIGWVYDGTLYHYIYANMFEGLEDGETITLTASWEVIDYEISYVNVETHNNPTSYNVETNSFTLINPTKEWHNFLGWTTDGVDEPTLTMVVDTSTIGNKEYEAHFEPVTFTINYSMDGGVTSEELVTSYVYGSNAIINLEEPTKETVNGVYYVFNGYRLEDGEVISVINKRNVTEFVDSNNVINIEATWIPHSISSEEALSDSTTAAKFALYGLEHYHYDTNSDDYYWLPEFEEANSLYGNELIDQFEYKDSAEIVEYADYVNEYVNAIEGMLPLGTTQEKALALADLIMNGNDTLGIEGIYYQADINADNYVTIEDAVTVRSEETGNRVTNCQGHARLFNAVARKLGIVSASVTGVSKSTGVAHMWNLVYDDGNYYEIDVVQVGTHTEYSGTAGYWSPEGEQQALYNNTDYEYAKEFLQLLVNSTIYDLN